MIYSLYLLFGILPSLAWLLFYLRKDAHPESKTMILKIFFCGMIIALPTYYAQRGFFYLLEKFYPGNSLFLLIISVFLGVAFLEEFFKYLIVRFTALRSSELDEPVDIMIYMIVAALGFAAVENILILLSMLLKGELILKTALIVVGFRSLGATFLHALSSGTLGYFVALANLRLKEKKKILFSGFFVATILHGIFNLSIMEIDEGIFFSIAGLIIFSLAVAFAFEKLKKLKSVCHFNK